MQLAQEWGFFFSFSTSEQWSVLRLQALRLSLARCQCGGEWGAWMSMRMCVCFLLLGLSCSRAPTWYRDGRYPNQPTSSACRFSWTEQSSRPPLCTLDW